MAITAIVESQVIAGATATGVLYVTAGGLLASDGATWASNTLTVAGLIDVTAPAATDIPLSITGAPSQSANMTEWTLNGGTVRATITAAGEFTNPAAASAGRNEAFGLSALSGLTSGVRNTAIGAYSLTQVTAGGYNTAVGESAATWVDGTGRTAVGYLAGKAGGGNYSTYLGYNCVPQTGLKTSCVFLGASQTTTTEQAYTGTILIGANVAANGDNEFIAGSSSHPINNVYFGKGFDNATPTSYTIHGTGGSGTDIAGADVVIAGGAGTGTGVGGDVLIQYAAAGTTGTAANALATALTIDGSGDATFSGPLSHSPDATGKLTRGMSSETHTLSLATTSDTTTISIPSGARLLAVQMNVDTAVTDGAGDDTWSAAFITGSTTTIATGAAAALNTKVNLMLPDEITTGIAEIRFTPNAGSFTAGVIEMTVYYEFLTSLANA